MSADRYKIGDKVRVRQDLDVRQQYGNIGVGSIMVNMGGETLTIKRIDKLMGHHAHYHVKENGWNWTDEMLENCIPELENDNSVINDDAISFDKSIKDLFDLYNL